MMSEVPSVNLSGIWKLDRNENFTEFLKAVGAGLVARTMASKTSPVVEIEQNGNDFHVVTKTMVTTIDNKFTIGTEFNSKNAMAGKEMKNIPSWEDDKLVIVSTPMGEPDASPVIVQRHIVDGELVQTMIAKDKGKDVVCKRWFKKQATCTS